MPMRQISCRHCGHENPVREPYCLACGARLEYVGREDAPGTGDTQPSVEPPVPPTASPPPEEKPPRPEEPTGRPVIADLEGLLPRPELPHPFAWQEPVADGSGLSPETARRLQGLPRVGIPAGAARDTVRGVFPRFAQVRWPMLFLLATALLTTILAPGIGEGVPYQYGGSLSAARHLAELNEVSRVLVFWQNHPGVAGELDTAVAPVLAALMQPTTSLSFFSQHPLALPRAQIVLDDVHTSLLRGLPEGAMPIGMTTVSAMTYWPGGPATLPAMASNSDANAVNGNDGDPASGSESGVRERLRAADYGLHLIVTDQAVDVVHWLELVSPSTQVPVLAVTSAAAAPLLGPYLETGQLAGVVSGIGDAHHLAEPLAGNATEDLTRRTLAMSRFQSWLSIALALVVLGALLARGVAPQP